MNRKNVFICVILEAIILVLTGIFYIFFGFALALSLFAIFECAFLLVNGLLAYRKYKYSNRFREKQSLEQASENLSATDLRDWVEFSNSFSVEKPIQEEKQDLFEEEDLLEMAQKKWQQELRTERGEMQYSRILANWKNYIKTCLQDKKITDLKKCQLDIIRFMIEDNAPIKHKDTMIQYCNLKGYISEMAVEAIDQLLIQRAIIIAIEGSLEYYRLNLGWNILQDIEKAKKILAIQEEELQSENDSNEMNTESTLDSTTIQKVEEQDIVQSVTRYRNEIKEQLIGCMEEEPDAISIIDLLANHSELRTVNQLSLEEIMKELVQQGQAIRLEDTYPIRYRLTRKNS